jgi:hypothetical protein
MWRAARRFHVHALTGNGDGDEGSYMRCSTSGTPSRARCIFYKRWFELEEFRLVWKVGNGTSLKKVFSLSTKDTQGTTYNFSSETALVPTHPYWDGFEGEQQVLRVSDAP